MAIISGNTNINKIYYNGYTISKIYACGGSLVWSGGTTPTGATKWIGTYTNHDPNSGVCDSSSVLTNEEIINNIPYTGWTWNLVETLEIGDCVTSIGSIEPTGATGICNSCTNLTAVTIPNSVTTIGDNSFYGCNSLSSITIPNSVTQIGGRAFNSCKSLLDITVPSGVTYIGKAAFGSIGSNSPYKPLIFTILATTPPTLETYSSSYLPFNGSAVELYVPCESVNDYKAASGWSTYADKIKPINGSCTSYSGQYLTFRAEENSMFRFSQPSKYSLDSGTTWTSLASNTWTPTVASGDTIMWKTTTSQSNSAGTFSSSGMFIAEGNPLSLVFEDNFDGQTSLANGYLYVLSNLFSGCTNLASAENLSLPATTLAESCYESMFQGCTSLTTAPELPATTLETACYANMFSGCTSLTSAPELQATALYNGCYAYMFANCTSLTAAPNLPATALDNSCYTGMFMGCTSLTTVQSVLPATTMKYSCYNAMFEGCTSLTTAPELPATILAEQCYSIMFAYCTNLNYVKCNATDISANVCTTNWLINVASSGTFVKNPSMSSWTNGNSGIPNGWTVIDAS